MPRKGNGIVQNVPRKSFRVRFSLPTKTECYKDYYGKPIEISIKSSATSRFLRLAATMKLIAKRRRQSRRATRPVRTPCSLTGAFVLRGLVLFCDWLCSATPKKQPATPQNKSKKTARFGWCAGQHKPRKPAQSGFKDDEGNRCWKCAA